MGNPYFERMFTPAVQAEQARHGSRAAYARLEAPDGAASYAALGEQEARFISERDSFYLATISETGWPYVQHRGGPVSFVRVAADGSLGWADFSGNRQYVSIGNVARSARVSLFFMDYAHRQRLKVLGRLRAVEAGKSPELAASFADQDYAARIEHFMLVEVEAFDWNCPQYITQRFTSEQVELVVAPLRQQIAELKAQLAAAGGAKP